MADNNDRLRVLLNGYANQTTSEAEESELFELLSDTNDTSLEALLTEIFEKTEPAPDAARRERILSSILKSRTSVRRMWSRWAVAASIIILVAAGGYFLFLNTSTKQPNGAKQNQPTRDVAAPNVARATLKLDDGRIVFLDSANNGSLAKEGNVDVVKLADGQIAYQPSDQNAEPARLNTLTNPRGSRVVSITLVDGTKVWLNAESSITYPTSMNGSERKVEITGEAYFQVVHNEAKPFIVKNTSKHFEVQVLGTEFNVNTYDDEETPKVTLVNGRVKVSKTGATKFLEPGEQAQITSTISIKTDIDIDGVLAWKNGLFLLENTDLPTIMRQISRWYDVDVAYEGKIPDRKFGGGVSKNLPLSKILELLESNGLHFKLEGKKLTVRE